MLAYMEGDPRQYLHKYLNPKRTKTIINPLKRQLNLMYSHRLVKIWTFIYLIQGKIVTLSVYFYVDICSDSNRGQGAQAEDLRSSGQTAGFHTDHTNITDMCAPPTSTYMYAAFTSACITSASKNRSPD